jgi:hypothetical protein
MKSRIRGKELTIFRQVQIAPKIKSYSFNSGSNVLYWIRLENTPSGAELLLFSFRGRGRPTSNPGGFRPDAAGPDSAGNCTPPQNSEIADVT